MTRVKTGMYCTASSEKNSDTMCARALDRMLDTTWSPVSLPAWINVTFSTDQNLTFIRLLQSPTNEHQIRSIAMRFSDNSTQTVSLEITQSGHIMI